MLKKAFGIIIASIILLFSSYVCASNDMGESMNKAANGARNVVGGAENVVEDAVGSIGTGIKDLGNTFTDGASRVTSGDNMHNGDYTATRTSADTNVNGSILGMSPTTWTWFVLAIATLAIVGLVWYYAMQNSNEYNNNNN